MSSQRRSPSRRRFLRHLTVPGVGALAGCFSPEMGGSVDDIAVYNATDEQVEVSLDVYELPDERQIVDDSFTLDAEERRGYPQPFTEDRRKRLAIAVDETRRSTHEWSADAESGSTGVDIVVRDDEIDIDQISG